MKRMLEAVKKGGRIAGAVGLASLLCGGSCAWARDKVIAVAYQSRDEVAVGELAGPRPPRALIGEPIGYLEVYSATEQHPTEENFFAYPHTDYRIYRGDGAFIKWVSNSISLSDEMPSHEMLPCGVYIIRAESETAGRVSVPIVVKPGRTTVLHLEREKDWPVDAFAKSPGALVRLPNGQPIGWKAIVR